MAPQAFALFDTPIGTCGVAWNKNGIAGMDTQFTINSPEQYVAGQQLDNDVPGT